MMRSHSEIPSSPLRSPRLSLAAVLLLSLAVSGFGKPEPSQRPVSETALSRSAGAAGIELRERRTFPKPAKTTVSPNSSIESVAIKFREDYPVRLRGGALVPESGALPGALRAELQPYLATSTLTKLFSGAPEGELSRKQETLSLARGMALADLNNYFRIDVTGSTEAERLVNALNGFAEIEIAYVEPTPEVAGDIAPPTDAFDTLQTYLNAAPEGIDALYAHTIAGGGGSTVKIIDVENAWNTAHEDLDAAAAAFVEIGNTEGVDSDHGTAVIGELIGGDNGYGVTGICPDAEIGMISTFGSSAAEAFLESANHLDPGDIMLIELHAPGPHFDYEIRGDQLGYVCMEFFPAEFDALQYLWAQGIVVVEAAGNGAENYDDTTIYGPLFDTTYRNSHAIIVGAGAPPNGAWGVDRSRLGFSCYGSRVNLQGYGRDVVTTGYGGLFSPGGDENQYYTATFSGTSSASPIVTGAVACLQGAFRADYGVSLTSDQIRDILISTGSVQLGNLSEHIGPRPNLAAAIPALGAPGQLRAAPIFVEDTVDAGQQKNRSVWLVNSSPSSSVDFSVQGEDSLFLGRASVPDWLQVSPGGGTVAPADSLELTVTLDATVLTDQVAPYKGFVSVQWSESGGALDSTIVTPVYLTVPCFDTSYNSSNSDSVSGPSYEWIDIIPAGQLIPHGIFYNYGSAPLDDGTAGPLGIPFDFPFFEQTYDQIWVGVNGGVSFTDTNVNYTGYFNQLNIPGAPFETFIAAFWNDLTIDPDGGGHGDIYFRPLTNFRYALTWSQVGNFNSASDTLVTFQLILHKNGDILLQYQDVGNTGLAASALIGLQANGCSFEGYYDQGDPAPFEVGSGSAVLFEYTGTVLEQAGDADRSGSITIGDVTYLIATIFSGGPIPDPPGSGDPDCSGHLSIADVTFLVQYIFSGGAEPCYYEL